MRAPDLPLPRPPPRMRTARRARLWLARERDAVRAVATFVTSREQRLIVRLERNLRSALTAPAQVMMPKEAGGDGAPRAPRRGHFLQAFRRRALAQALYFLYCGGQGQISHGPNIRAAQRAQ